jgi:hypothetical protein
MSIKIEILDYKYGIDNMTDVNAGSASTGWTATSSTSAYWDGSGSGISYLNNISTPSLVIGTAYNLSFEITNYSGTGDMGFSFTGGVPLTARFSSNTNGVKYFTFIATGAVSLDLFGISTNSGNISSISIKDANVIDWENSVVGELDITDHTNFPLAMTFQISDFKDITSTSGDYSKTFKIPATKNNNQIFKNLYIANIDVDNNVTARKKCRILVDNLYSTLGLIKVNGVSGYGENASHYDCVFFGNNLTWASGIDNAYMSDIDWGTEGEGLTYNKSSIMDTWQHEDSNNASKSPIVYPITSYGQYNEGGDERTIQLLNTRYDSGTTPNSSSLGYYGTNSSNNDFGTPIPSADWRPTIFVKKTLDKIFAGLSGGFKISSSFMNTPMFKKLVWSLPSFKYNNPTDRITKYSYGNQFTGEGLIPISSTATSILIDPPSINSYADFTSVINLNLAGADFVLDTDRENTGWDASTGIYTVQEYGFHNTVLNNFGLFGTRVNYYGGSLDVQHARIELQLSTVGEGNWNTIEYTSTDSFYDSGSNQLSSNPSQSFNGAIDNNTYLNKGDQLRLRLKVRARTFANDGNEIRLYLFGASTPQSTTLSVTANGSYSINLIPYYVEYGQTYDLSEVINKDMKQIDFIKGVAHAFNLQMTTDSESRIVYIEPFNDFYKPLKDGIDWTYKVDRSKEISDEWLKTDLKRIMTFKYKSDNADAKVKFRGEEYFDGIQDEYPYRERLADTFDKGDSTFENPFFAGTYNAKDNDTTANPNVDTAYSACLWTENVSSNDDGRPPKGYDFLPRLLYWNKYSPAVSSLHKIARVQTWSATTDWITAGANTVGVLSGIYPQATMINRDSNTSPVLSYGNIPLHNYNDSTGVYGAGEIGSGLYETYYRNSIEMLKANPRIRNVYVNLKISDIINLDFTKLIYIDGVYWRISKVSDYMPNKNESTKVELIEWLASRAYSFNVPVFNGRPRIWGEGSGTPYLKIREIL